MRSKWITCCCSFVGTLSILIIISIIIIRSILIVVITLFIRDIFFADFNYILDRYETRTRGKDYAYIPPLLSIAIQSCKLLNILLYDR